MSGFEFTKEQRGAARVLWLSYGIGSNSTTTQGDKLKKLWDKSQAETSLLSGMVPEKFMLLMRYACHLSEPVQQAAFSQFQEMLAKEAKIAETQGRLRLITHEVVDEAVTELVRRVGRPRNGRDYVKARELAEPNIIAELLTTLNQLKAADPAIVRRGDLHAALVKSEFYQAKFTERALTQKVFDELYRKLSSYQLLDDPILLRSTPQLSSNCADAQTRFLIRQLGALGATAKEITDQLNGYVARRQLNHDLNYCLIRPSFVNSLIQQARQKGFVSRRVSSAVIAQMVVDLPAEFAAYRQRVFEQIKQSFAYSKGRPQHVPRNQPTLTKNQID